MSSDYDPLQMGKVIQRLDDQDDQIGELRGDVKQLLGLAHQGKGSLIALASLGSILGAIGGWLAEHFWKT
jgi:hypothetical protein